MMKFLRQKGVMKVLLWGIAGVVILSFGILSNAYLLNKTPGKISYAGKIFGKKISLDEFERHYQFMIIQKRMQYGQNFNKVAAALDLEQQTWNQIILLQEAKRRRIKVSDKEVIEKIQEYQFFMNPKTGQFDPRIYQLILRQSLRITTRAFEEGIRDALTVQKLYERETFPITVSEDEVLNAYKEINEKRKVSYVIFPIDEFKKEVSYDEIKIKNYFLTHKNDFAQPASINVFYMSFPFNPDNDQSTNSAYDKAFNALAAIRSGNEFSTVANTNNIKIKETGFFNSQQPNLSLGWPLETFQDLFTMKEGQVSDIITTNNSYDLLQLHRFRPPYLPPYAEVAEEVKEAFLTNEAMKLSKTKAQDLFESFKQSPDFTKTAQQHNLDVTQTPEFNFGQYLPVIGPSLLFQRTAFSLTLDNRISDPVPTEKGYVIMHLNEIIAADMQKFENDKDDFTGQILMRKKMQHFNNFTEELVKKSNLEDLISAHLKR